MEYASKGVGSAGLTTGIIGAGLSSAAVISSVVNAIGKNRAPQGDSGDGAIVTRYELGLVQENAYLKAQSEVNEKLLGLSDRINEKIYALNSKVDSNAASQAVINCGFNSSIGILQTQVEALSGMTKLVIPNSSVCPGWGTATVSVSTGTTTT